MESDAGIRPGTRESGARQRLLDTAQRVFYAEGIHTVGVDRLVTEAGVTRATFYKYFPSKDSLVLAYIECEDDAVRGLFAAAAASGDDMLGALIEGIVADVTTYHTRGCPFINAAAEYSDPDHPVRRVIAAHRAWFAAGVTEICAESGLADPAEVGRSLVLLRDAALVGAYLDGPEVAVGAFRTAAHRVTGR